MGVVRREGDWRLEKRADGKYEITYQHETQMKVLTPEYSPGMAGSPMVDTVPVREVDSYSEAEGQFEEMAHGDPPSVTEGLDVLSRDLDVGKSTNQDAHHEDDLEEIDLPPGGFALVFLIVGGFSLYTAGLNTGSILFQFGAIMSVVGIAIIGWAGVLYETHGPSKALDFLLTVEDSTRDRSSEKSNKR